MYGMRPTELPYRASPRESGPTFGDYEFGIGHPPGLGSAGQEAYGEVPIAHPAAAPVQGPTPPAAMAPEASAGTTAPSPLDVLITGMSQLQQVLLKQKGGEALDLELKAVNELAKLPEYTPESGATDFQDYLYLAEQQIGSLASGAAEWWQKTLSVAQKAYSEYQSLSPMKRLSVKASLTEELKEDRYKKLERKVASLMLSSLPRGVRDELVAHRVQGVHQILFRLMVVFQPGGAQDRAQLLKQLDVSESSPGPAEAVVAIRKWYRLLQRAADLNRALPDESLQVRSLSTIVKKTAESHSDFKFRMALARTELQIDSRPSQSNVLRFLQHLLAELEQLGAGSRRSGGQTTTTTTATTPSLSTPTAPTLKGVQPTSEPADKGKSKGKGGTPSPKKACQWFGTDNGCRNGKQCAFTHSWSGLNRAERCLLCGSKQHRAKECPAPQEASEKAPPPPPTSRSLAAASAPGTTTPNPKEAARPQGQGPSASSTSSSTSASGGGNKIDAAKMTEILSETNKMLKALTSQSVTGPPPSNPQDPLVLIQQQLDEVRRLKTLVVREPGPESSGFSSAVAWYEARLNSSMVGSAEARDSGEALLDSGASHPFRPVATDAELSEAKRVVVLLATGEERSILQTQAGTLLSEHGEEPPLVPMGQLVSLLGCTIRWCPRKLVVIHPVHGRLQVRLRGACPVLPVRQALSLIAELEQARMEQFERTVEDLRTQMKMLRDQGRDDWTWERHLSSLREEGDRTSMAGFIHRCPAFASLSPEALLGLPEAIPRGQKDGWKLLKGLPWSRAKRKSLFQSDGWIVHLFSGDDRTREARDQAVEALLLAGRSRRERRDGECRHHSFEDYGSSPARCCFRSVGLGRAEWKDQGDHWRPSTTHLSQDSGSTRRWWPGPEGGPAVGAHVVVVVYG